MSDDWDYDEIREAVHNHAFAETIDDDADSALDATSARAPPRNVARTSGNRFAEFLGRDELCCDACGDEITKAWEDGPDLGTFSLTVSGSSKRNASSDSVLCCDSCADWLREIVRGKNDE